MNINDAADDMRRSMAQQRLTMMRQSGTPPAARSMLAAPPADVKSAPLPPPPPPDDDGLSKLHTLLPQAPKFDASGSGLSMLHTLMPPQSKIAGTSSETTIAGGGKTTLPPQSPEQVRGLTRLYDAPPAATAGFQEKTQVGDLDPQETADEGGNDLAELIKAVRELVETLKAQRGKAEAEPDARATRDQLMDYTRGLSSALGHFRAAAGM